MRLCKDSLCLPCKVDLSPVVDPIMSQIATAVAGLPALDPRCAAYRTKRDPQATDAHATKTKGDESVRIHRPSRSWPTGTSAAGLSTRPSALGRGSADADLR